MNGMRLLLDHAQIGAHRQRVVMAELEVGHVRVARRDAPFERAREFIEIDTAAKRAKWRRPFMSTPATGAHCMTTRAEFRRSEERRVGKECRKKTDGDDR